MVFYKGLRGRGEFEGSSRGEMAQGSRAQLAHELAALMRRRVRARWQLRAGGWPFLEPGGLGTFRMATSPRRSPRIRLDRTPTWACGIRRRPGRRPHHGEAALEKTGRARRVGRIGGAEPERPDLPNLGRGV